MLAARCLLLRRSRRKRAAPFAGFLAFAGVARAGRVAKPAAPAAEPHEPSFEWVGESLRHAGTVVHAFLQRMPSVDAIRAPMCLRSAER